MRASDLDASFSRLGLRGQLSASQTGTPSGAVQTQSVLASAQRTADGALGRLQAMRRSLTDGQKSHLSVIENCNRLRGSARTNGDIVRPPAGAVPPIGERITLARSPSFLLADPVLSNMGDAMPRDTTGFARPLSAADQALLTAQVANIRLQIKTNQQQAADQARRGERICTLPFDAQRFDAFLDRHKPLLRQVVAAFERGGEDRDTVLESGLASLATDYLRTVNRLPSGLAEGEYINMDGVLFDSAPVSVALIPEKGMVDRSVIDCGDSDKLIIWIKTGGLDALPDDAMVADEGLEGWSEQLAGCTVAQEQAGVILQNLFFALATTEETQCLDEERAAERRGTAMSAAARRTDADFDYEGSAAIGDDFDDEDGASQRSASVVPMTALAFRAQVYEDIHGTPLLTDPQLDRWVNSPALDSDLLSLVNPSFRMRMAQIDVVAEALRRTGVFSA